MMIYAAQDMAHRKTNTQAKNDSKGSTVPGNDGKLLDIGLWSYDGSLAMDGQIKTRRFHTLVEFNSKAVFVSQKPPGH